jgi:hypothetical protein
MDATSSNDQVRVTLSQEEALVLSAWLLRFNAAEHATVFEDQAEQRVLWDLEASLEKVLTAPFASNYDDLLASARESIRDEKD